MDLVLVRDSGTDMTKNKLANNLGHSVSDFEFQPFCPDTDSISQGNTPANLVESEHACIDRHALMNAML